MAHIQTTLVHVMLGKVFEDMYSEARHFIGMMKNFSEYRGRHAFMVCPIPQAGPGSISLQVSDLTPLQYEFHWEQSTAAIQM